MLFQITNNNVHFSKTVGQPIDEIQLPPQILQPFSFESSLQERLVGKQLLEDELPFSLLTLQIHYEKGYLSIKPGLQRVKGGFVCQRCHNQDDFYSYHCARCKRLCTYCRRCIEMGRVSQCTPLFTWNGPMKPFSQSIIQWKGTLSPAQDKASQKIKETIVKRQSPLLVWAVCGAGKTEMIFEGVFYALHMQQRVCIAAPRKDVILELSPRLKEAFPQTTIATLYGGSDEKHQYAQLVLATTHQLYRFKEAFDLIVVDEVDAFPYTFDTSLQQAVQTARKTISSLIYLTATPSKEQLKNWPHVQVSRRYHGHPLPVPTFSWCGNWTKQLEKGRIPTNLYKFLQEKSQQDASLFLFVPQVRHIPMLRFVLQKHFSLQIEGVHAEDEERIEKVQRFRRGETKWMITTTILERGVTIPNSHVAVIGSEYPIFTTSALVQVAGRVGRSPKYPTGDVVFFHFGKTEAMIEARQQIRSCNEVKN